MDKNKKIMHMGFVAHIASGLAASAEKSSDWDDIKKDWYEYADYTPAEYGIAKRAHKIADAIMDIYDGREDQHNSGYTPSIAWEEDEVA